MINNRSQHDNYLIGWHQDKAIKRKETIKRFTELTSNNSYEEELNDIYDEESLSEQRHKVKNPFKGI